MTYSASPTRRSRIAGIINETRADPVVEGAVTFTYSSGGDTNGLFYWYGTNFGTEAWTNPVTASRFTASAFGTSSPSLPVSSLFNRAVSSEYFFINGSSSNHSRVEIYLPKKFRLINMAVKAGSDINTARTFEIRGWNAGGSYETSASIAAFLDRPSPGIDAWDLIPINSPAFYDNYVFDHITSTNGDRFIRTSEFEFYGVSAP